MSPHWCCTFAANAVRRHALWSAVGGRYARVFIGVTKGWFATGARPPTPEEICEQLAQIEDRHDFGEPLSGTEEFDRIIESAGRHAGLKV